MKKRQNSAPWTPDEASPYLNESSRCAESESEEHFVRKADFSADFSVKKCYFPVKRKLQNWVAIMFQRNIWGQLDVRTRMRASKSWNFDLEKPIKPIENGLLRHFYQDSPHSGPDVKLTGNIALKLDFEPILRFFF